MSARITYRPAPNINAVFTYTGADQTYVVPAGITTMTVTLWGAGGGSSISPAGGGTQTGGAGACLTGTLLVTPGETLTIIVGGPGTNTSVSSARPYGGGGIQGRSGQVYSSSGGGRSAIRRSTTDVVTVGAGGGGRNGIGGAGGITTGGTGQNSSATGGTQTEGGVRTGGGLNGTLNLGGDAGQDNSAAGGSGYYGGGGGGQDNNGGGGSSLYSNLLSYTGYTSATGVAPNNTSPLYVTGVGNGGTYAGGGTGGPGLVVLSVSNLAAPPLTITVGNVLSSTGTAFTTDNTTYTFPAGVSKVRVFVWGGGGSGAYTTGCGGSGAYVEGDIDKGNMTTLTIYLNRAGGGHGPGSGAVSGGGYGAVYNSTNGYLMVAGAGGSGFGNYGYYGGGGGYLQGFAGGSPTLPGTQTTARNRSNGGGGSQTQGGQGGWGNSSGLESATDGSYLTGGNGVLGTSYGSGGGGGYYGGGGGNGNGYETGYSGAGAGGGGSSYINTGFVKNYKGGDGQNGTTSSVLPGGSTSPFYVSGYGVGKYNGAGGGALVVIVPYLSGGGGAVATTGLTKITLGSSSIRALGGVTTIYNTYKIHTFATAGTATFTVTPPNALTVKVLVVGGGGGGGSDASLYGGGGGAGGLVYSRTMSLTPGTYQVVVGAGGPAGTIGGDSTFNGLTGSGGGYGGGSSGSGGNGGCGGGSGGSGGSPGTGSQGFAGGSGSSQYVGGGGGGGMGSAAATTRPNVGNGASYVNGFQGGNGVQVQITGTPTYYAGGGGGGGGNGVSGGAPGGAGGGGTGGGYYAATAGTAGLGGGGGCGAAGGSGTVIVAYLLPGQIATVTTPSVASGLIFWLDGADPAGTGVLPANGASVATWVDKSGNSKNATATSTAATYSLASKALVFTGTQFYTTPFTTVPTTISVFMVVNINTTGYVDILSGVLQVNINNLNQIVTIPGGSHVLDGAAMPANTNVLYNFTFDSTASAYIYYNGALSGSRNGATSYTGNGTINVGGSDGVHEMYNGNINEVLIYNSVLSAVQRQKIEGYLAWKWGLQASLSGSNPYKYDLPM